MKAALLLLASLAAFAGQANACDIKGPIDIVADKVCGWKEAGKATCLKCVKKIFRNEGECEYDVVEFPPQLAKCQTCVKDKAFKAKLDVLCLEKYVGHIESLLEKIPKLKSKFCSDNGALNDFMKDSVEEGPGIVEQMKNSEFGKSCANGASNPVVTEAIGAIKDVGFSAAKRNGNSYIQAFRNLITKICGEEEVCVKMKACMTQMLGYVVDYATKRRRKRWLEEKESREALSLEALLADSNSIESWR